MIVVEVKAKDLDKAGRRRKLLCFSTMLITFQCENKGLPIRPGKSRTGAGRGQGGQEIQYSIRERKYQDQ